MRGGVWLCVKSLEACRGVCVEACGFSLCPWPRVAAVCCRSCSRGKLTVFTVLCEQYQPALRRDPMYNEVRGGAGRGGGGAGGGGEGGGEELGEGWGGAGGGGEEGGGGGVGRSCWRGPGSVSASPSTSTG